MSHFTHYFDDVCTWKAIVRFPFGVKTTMIIISHINVLRLSVWHRCWQHKLTDSPQKRYSVVYLSLIIVIIADYWGGGAGAKCKKNRVINANVAMRGKPERQNESPLSYRVFLKEPQLLWKCWLNLLSVSKDGADVRCLPSWHCREPWLQEPGSHHHPRRGKGPGIGRTSFRPAEGDMNCRLFTRPPPPVLAAYLLLYSTHRRAEEDQSSMFPSRPWKRGH